MNIKTMAVGESGPFGGPMASMGGGRLTQQDRILTILDSKRNQHLSIVFKQLPAPQLVIDSLNGIATVILF